MTGNSATTVNAATQFAGEGAIPLKTNFWIRLLIGWSGVTSVTYRFPFESTAMWWRVPNSPGAEPGLPKDPRTSRVFLSRIMTRAWLRLPTYKNRCSGSGEKAVLAAV